MGKPLVCMYVSLACESFKSLCISLAWESLFRLTLVRAQGKGKSSLGLSMVWESLFRSLVSRCYNSLYAVKYFKGTSSSMTFSATITLFSTQLTNY